MFQLPATWHLANYCPNNVQCDDCGLEHPSKGCFKAPSHLNGFASTKMLKMTAIYHQTQTILSLQKWVYQGKTNLNDPYLSIIIIFSRILDLIFGLFFV